VLVWQAPALAFPSSLALHSLLQPQNRPHHIYLVGSKKSNELGYLHIEVGGPAGGAVCGG